MESRAVDVDSQVMHWRARTRFAEEDLSAERARRLADLDELAVTTMRLDHMTTHAAELEARATAAEDALASTLDVRVRAWIRRARGAGRRSG